MGMSLNGRTITHARTQTGAWGRWYVDAKIDGDAPISGAAKLVLNDLTLEAFVLSGGTDRGRTSVRVVGGKGGWGRELPAKSYANDAGVKIATVVRDAAESCGESFDASTASGTVGPSFVRPEGPAARVLELVAPGAWYVGEDGVTRLGKRPARELPMGVTRVSNDPALGTALLASETLSGLLPGLVVDGLAVVDVEHEITPGKVRTTVWTERRGASRQLVAFQKLFAALDPLRAFRGTYEYRVEGTQGKRLNLAPVRQSTGMPTLLRVPVRPGIPGADADYLNGTRVLVTFIDANPSRPAIVGFEDASGGAFVPTVLRLAEGTMGAAREGDSVEVTLNIPSTPFSGTATGTITGGSSKVRIGG